MAAIHRTSAVIVALVASAAALDVPTGSVGNADSSQSLIVTELPASAAALVSVQSSGLPHVRHYKQPGGGYQQISPLFKKQHAWEKIMMASSLKTPLSTSLRCVVNLVTQFFAVYTCLFMMQLLNHFKVIRRDSEIKSLFIVAETVYFVPMLCVLFLATRMRAVQLCRGHSPDDYSLPQWWVKDAMVMCSWTMLFLTLITFACAIHWGDVWEAAAKNGSLGKFGRVCVAFKNTALTMVYASFTLICIGLVIMPVPVGLWQHGGGPSVNPAILCTVALSVLYFGVYLALAFARVWNDLGLGGPPQRFSPAQELLKSATMSVAFGPMLCILFIAVRLRAAQFNSHHGDPPRWMQCAFFVSTGSVYVQTLLAIAGRSSSDVFVFEGGTGNLASDKGTSIGAKVLEVVRSIATFCLFVSVAVVLIGLSLMGERESLPMPIALECVLILTVLYFAIYFALSVVLTLQKRADSDLFNAVSSFLEQNARESVNFCPMFCVLFVGTLMHALQINPDVNTSGDFRHDVQRIATLFIVALTFSRLDSCIPPGKKGSLCFTNFCIALYWVCLCAIYASAVALVMSLALMHP
eukprot:TRINITY_DN16171_c0_g1_i1.p1 TRINITY_DN16171_c0_g1~~TRINITY_DN16171_c0_g1_i1.p1  ORF type:complete len:580 (-),score=66.37 TRINITY_DN16171_c0_g1_i1:211-1950(-)